MRALKRSYPVGDERLDIHNQFMLAADVTPRLHKAMGYVLASIELIRQPVDLRVGRDTDLRLIEQPAMAATART